MNAVRQTWFSIVRQFVRTVFAFVVGAPDAGKFSEGYVDALLSQSPPYSVQGRADCVCPVDSRCHVRHADAWSVSLSYRRT